MKTPTDANWADLATRSADCAARADRGTRGGDQLTRWRSGLSLRRWSEPQPHIGTWTDRRRRSGLGQRPGGPYGRDDIAYCLRGCGGVGFVVQQGFVGGVLGDTVGSVGRQCGHLVLRLLPSSGVPGVCGEDDERLTVEVGQRRRLLRRRVRRDELLDPAAKVSGRSRRWRAPRLGSVAEDCRRRPGRSAVRHPGEPTADNTAETRPRTLYDSVLVGRAGPGLGAVESRSTRPATWSG